MSAGTPAPLAEILPAEGAFAPIDGQLIACVTEAGEAVYAPHPGGAHTLVPIRAGLQLAWIPIDDAGTIVLVLFSGGAGEFGFAATLTGLNLDDAIAKLQSIRAQSAGG